MADCQWFISVFYVFGNANLWPLATIILEVFLGFNIGMPHNQH